MQISIIIPHRAESIITMDKLLSSLNTQTGIDYDNFEFFFVNSCATDKLALDDLEPYENVKNHAVILESEANLGMTKQAGIENASGDYLVFFNPLDELPGDQVLTKLYNKVKPDEPKPEPKKKDWVDPYASKQPEAPSEEPKELMDVYYYEFFDEAAQFVSANDPEDNKRIVGKLFRKQFILDKGVAFNPDVTYAEDEYFMSVLNAYEPKTEGLGEVIVTSNSYPSTEDFIHYPEYIDMEIKRRERLSGIISASEEVTQTIKDIVGAYIMYNRYDADLVEPEFITAIETKLNTYINKFDFNCDFWHKYGTLLGEFLRRAMNPRLPMLPKVGFKDFISRILTPARNVDVTRIK